MSPFIPNVKKIVKIAKVPIFYPKLAQGTNIITTPRLGFSRMYMPGQKFNTKTITLLYRVANDLGD